MGASDVEVWIPPLVIANLICGFFIIKTLILADPALPSRAWGALRAGPATLLRLLTCGRLQRREGRREGAGRQVAGSCHGGSDATATAAAPPRDSGSSSAPADAVAVCVFGGGGAPAPFPTSAPTHSTLSPTLSTVLENVGGGSTPSAHPDAAVIRRASTLISHVTLEWRDLGCSYKTASGMRTVLQGVWGVARPREMHALIGPSGAGKSTLMDLLTQRKRVGSLTGQLLVNGVQAGPRAMARRSAYVPQEDSFIPTMTTLETLAFKAAMVLPPRLSGRARAARSLEVVEVVGLSHATHTMVGGTLPGGLSMRGLSGGERKRLAIAAGILAAPGILFLDEPTSGLDSFAALTVMRYLASMAADAGHVVVASIHQPRSAIWSMFHAVTLLSKGLLMYSGTREAMVPWFTHTACLTHGAPTTAQLPWGGGLLAYLGELGGGDGGGGGAFGEEVRRFLAGEDGAGREAEEDAAPSTKPKPNTNINTNTNTKYLHPTADSTPPHPHLHVSASSSLPLPPPAPRPPPWWFWYAPEAHGVACDWVMDLVSVGFSKGQDPSLGRTLTSPQELQAAAAAFRLATQCVTGLTRPVVGQVFPPKTAGGASTASSSTSESNLDLHPAPPSPSPSPPPGDGAAAASPSPPEPAGVVDLEAGGWWAWPWLLPHQFRLTAHF